MATPPFPLNPLSTRAVAPQPVHQAPVQGREALSAPRGPSICPGYALGRGEPDPAHMAAPPVPKAVKECGSDPSRAAYHHLPGRQSWSGWVACPCDVKVASPGPHLPRRVQCPALRPPCRGLEHQAHTSLCHMRQSRPTVVQAGAPQPPPPPAFRHTRTGTVAFPTRGRRGLAVNGRPCDQTPGCGWVPQGRRRGPQVGDQVRP